MLSICSICEPVLTRVLRSGTQVLFCSPLFPVLLNAGGLGRLDAFGDEEKGVRCNPDCTFEDEDIEAAFRRIDEALAVHDTTRIGKIDIYFPLSSFQAGKLSYIESFLSRLKAEYIDTGKLKWATQREVYEAYMSWNGSAGN